MPKSALPFVCAAALAAPALAAPVADILPPKPAPETVEAARLERFKMDPIAKLAAEGRTLRRVSYADVYDRASLPAVTIEKKANGEVELTVVSYYGRVVDQATLKPEAWKLLTAKDRVGLAPRRVSKASNELCLGSTIVIEAAEGGKATRRDGDMCAGPADLAAMEYGRLVAEIAITSIPRCAEHYEATRESSWTLRDCMRWSFLPFEQRNFSGGGNEGFTSYATKTWNNLTPDLVKQIASEITSDR